jgi:ABC-type Fe3+ transport system permease subunit/sugar lactone lactonase YvrE
VVAAALLVWIAAIVWPAVSMAGWLRIEDLPSAPDFRWQVATWLLVRTWLIAAVVALGALMLAWPTGRLLADAESGRWWRWALIVPLLVPAEVWGYGWSLLIDPAGSVGAWLSGSGFLALWLPRAGVTALMVAWFWPLAAWILAYGFSRVDRHVLDQARLETASRVRLLLVKIQLMRGSLLTTWLVVWGLTLGSFTAFQLSGVETYGTELNRLWDLTRAPGAVAWAGLPLLLLAAPVAASVGMQMSRWGPHETAEPESIAGKGPAILSGAVCLLLMVVPVGLMLWWAHDLDVWKANLALSRDALAGSLQIGLVTAVAALGLGLGAAVLQRSTGGIARCLARALGGSLLVAAILPGALVGAAAVAAYHRAAFDWLYDSFGMVVVCHTARFGFVAVFFARWLAADYPRDLADLVRLDGVGNWQTIRHVWWPTYRHTALAIVLVTVMLSVGEISATVIVLPPGMPNMAELMYNQMHYAQQEQVVVLSLLWIAIAVVAALVVVQASTRAFRRDRPGRSTSGTTLTRNGVLLGALVAAGLSGCGGASFGTEGDVVALLGKTGRGPCQFVYPRAIALAADGSLFVVDRTARIQHLSADGTMLADWTMPEFEKGKPTGLSVGPDGLLYVADTHYHRVMVFKPDGTLLRQFGQLGEKPGEFIYPTDVAVTRDGTIYVTEYGGNDRVTIFESTGEVRGTFGSLGDGPEQFARPSAIVLDEKQQRLYVADAGNHRIGLFDLAGRPIDRWGAAGREPGMLRYPYDLCLLEDGSLLVCEFGNNRIQRFSSDGRLTGCWGAAGRGRGQLAYPWGVAADAGRAYVVDSGNNRIQVWRL